MGMNDARNTLAGGNGSACQAAARGSLLQPSQAAEYRFARHVCSQEPDPEMETGVFFFFLKICSSGDF